MKQLVLVGLSLVLLAVLVPATAMAEENVTETTPNDVVVDETPEPVDPEIAAIFAELTDPEPASGHCCTFQDYIQCGSYCANLPGQRCSENTQCIEGECICECVCL